MAKKEGEDKVYPSGYEHIDELVSQAQDRIKQIDEQIKNPRADKGPVPTPTPPGSPVIKKFGIVSHDAKFLEQQQANIREHTWVQVEKGTVNADPKEARLVRDEAREELFPNPFRKASPPEKNAAGSEWKDVERAQNLMDSYFSRNQPTPVKDRAEPVKAAPKKEFATLQTRFSQSLVSIPPEEPAKKAVSMSARFSQSLGFTKIEGGIGTGPGKTLEPEPDKD